VGHKTDWTGVGRRKMLASTEVRTSNHPAFSESLYGLRYPGHYIIHTYICIYIHSFIIFTTAEISLDASVSPCEMFVTFCQAALRHK